MEFICPNCKEKYEFDPSSKERFTCIECGYEFIFDEVASEEVPASSRKRSGKGKLLLIPVFIAIVAAVILLLPGKGKKQSTASAQNETRESRYEQLCNLIKNNDIVRFSQTVTPEEAKETSFDVPLLHVAAQQGNLEALQVLLNCGADINHEAGEIGSLFHIAIANNNMELFELLAKKGARMNTSPVLEPLLTAAARLGRHEMVKFIMTNSNEKAPELAIFAAIKNKHLLCFRELIDHCKPETCDLEGNSLLIAAVMGGHVQIVKEILDRNPYLDHRNNNRETALFAAIRKNNLLVAELFRGKKVDTNLTNAAGMTLPMICAQSNNFSMLPEFVTAENLDCIDNDGRRALYYAAQSCNEEMVSFLLKKGSPKRLDETFENLPFYAALLKGELNICQMLAEERFYTLKDSKGNNCLMLAANSGNAALVRFLLDKKLYSPHAVNADKQTARDIALKNSHTSVAEILALAMKNERYGWARNEADKISNSRADYTSKSNSLSELQKRYSDIPEAVSYIQRVLAQEKADEIERQTAELNKVISRASKADSADAVSILEKGINENPLASNLSTAKSRLSQARSRYEAEQQRLARKREREKRLDNMTQAELQSEIHSFINNWLNTMKDGESTGRFWFSPVLAQTFFSVQSWEIYNQKHWSARLNSVRVLVNSSNRGGSPIRKVWSVSIIRNDDYNWCITTISD